MSFAVSFRQPQVYTSLGVVGRDSLLSHWHPFPTLTDRVHTQDGRWDGSTRTGRKAGELHALGFLMRHLGPVHSRKTSFGVV